MTRCALIASLALAAGCGASPAPPAAERPTARSAPANGPRVADDYVAAAFPLGDGAPVDDFAVCDDDVALVARGGAITYAGFQEELLPATAGATSVACDSVGRVAVVARGALLDAELAVRARGAGVVAKLPKGAFHVLRAPGGTVYVYGTRSGGAAVLARVDAHAKPRTLYTGATPVRAAVAAGDGAVIAIVGRDIDLFDGDGPPKLLARASSDLDGVAVDAGGALFLSSARRVVRVAPDGVRVIAEEVHGPLAMRGAALYVLWRERSIVLRLAPAGGSALSR